MKFASAIFIVAGALNLAACVSTSSTASVQWVDVPTESRAIETLWRYHIGVVRTTLALEYSLNGDDFARSIQFLETLTGINSDTANWAGRIPTKDLPDTIKQWEAWYGKHQHHLRLSDDGCGVVLKRLSNE